MFIATGDGNSRQAFGDVSRLPEMWPLEWKRCSRYDLSLLEEEIGHSGGLILLMAVVQENKNNECSVLDHTELNQH